MPCRHRHQHPAVCRVQRRRRQRRPGHLHGQRPQPVHELHRRDLEPGWHLLQAVVLPERAGATPGTSSGGTAATITAAVNQTIKLPGVRQPQNTTATATVVHLKLRPDGRDPFTITASAPSSPLGSHTRSGIWEPLWSRIRWSSAPRRPEPAFNLPVETILFQNNAASTWKHSGYQHEFQRADLRVRKHRPRRRHRGLLQHHGELLYRRHHTQQRHVDRAKQRQLRYWYDHPERRRLQPQCRHHLQQRHQPERSRRLQREPMLPLLHTALATTTTLRSSLAHYPDQQRLPQFDQQHQTFSWGAIGGNAAALISVGAKHQLCWTTPTPTLAAQSSPCTRRRRSGRNNNAAFGTGTIDPSGRLTDPTTRQGNDSRQPS